MKEEAAAEVSICIGGHVCSCLSYALAGEDPQEGDIQTETCTDGRRPKSRYHVHQQHQSLLYLCLSMLMETRDYSKEHLTDLSLILLLNVKITPSAIICISLSIYLDSAQVKSFKVSYKSSELLNFVKLFFT